MKLLACHVENFGKLSDFSYTFDEGLSEIYAENGWGKSSLAAFLKAMLYGFEAKKERLAVDKERRIYEPWQGGLFGGQLDLQVEGKSYRILRTFGKTEKDDSFQLINLETMQLTNDYSERIGEEILDLDAASFKRSVYIPQSEVVAEATDWIHAKLGNVLEETGDVSHYDLAMSRFKDAMNRLSPDRATGAIKKEEQMLFSLQEEIRRRKAALKDGKSAASSMKEYEAKLSALEKEKRDCMQSMLTVGQREEKRIDDKDSGKRSIFILVAVLLTVMMEAVNAYAFAFMGTGGIALHGFAVLFLLLAVFLWIKIMQKRKDKKEDTGNSKASSLDKALLEKANFLDREILEVRRLLDESQRAEREYREEEAWLLEKEEACQKLMEDLERHREEYRLYETTSRFLSDAREAFNQRYLGKTEENFKRYYELLMEDTSLECSMDINLEVKKKEKGLYRQIDRFSLGSRELIGFCMRMALVEAMYQKEMPFLILDDPFANLDEASLKKALELLNCLEEKFQIIYFTCHSSRIA